ncbi:hypothetical protein PINS_up000448 [Pythium insidiosum]|nr:hypothetical protein PINS_up000448 [Pythium insidiosum]
MQEFDETTLANLMISGCPQTDVPAAIRRFTNLQTITLENLTLYDWPVGASLAGDFFPMLQTINLKVVNFKSRPDGLLVEPLPPSVEWVHIYRANMSNYIDMIGTKWQYLKYFDCDVCGLSTFPHIVSTMTGLLTLSLCSNRIALIPENSVKDLNTSFLALWLDANPLDALPDSLWAMSATCGDFSFQHTGISKLPPALANVKNPLLKIFGYDTPLCSGLVDPRIIHEQLYCQEVQYNDFIQYPLEGGQ